MKLQFFSENLSNEKRTLAQKPAIPSASLSSVKKWTEDFEKYFNDNFGFRNSLLKINVLVSFTIFKISPIPKVVIGKDGWLFYNNLKDGETFQDFFGKAPFTSAQHIQIKTYLHNLKKEFAQRDILFIVVLAPSKHTVYSDKLPENILRKKGISTKADDLDTIFSELDMNFLDLRKTMQDEKYISPYPLYYLTDTHWNNLGAFYGYLRIMDLIRTKYKTIPILHRSDFDIEVQQNSGNGDMALMVNMQGFLKDTMINLKYHGDFQAKPVVTHYGDNSLIFEKNDTTLGKLLMFRDSFCTALIPYLSESFSRSVYIYKPIDFTIVDKEKPNVVVLEFAERYSSCLLQ